MRCDWAVLRTLIAAVAAGAVPAACARQADTAAEERTIRDLDRKWVQAVAARDTMKIGDLYAEDGEFLPQGAPRVSGRAAIRSAWARLLSTPNLSLTFEPAKVVVSGAGDIACETGGYQLARDGPRGERLAETGKFVVVWKRVNNDWKVQYDIFNSDKPAAM